MNQKHANIPISNSIYQQGSYYLQPEDIEHMRHFKYRKVDLQENVEYDNIEIDVSSEDSEDEDSNILDLQEN